MARKRARKTYCPSCDGLLDPALAADEPPRCPACDEPLLPVRVAGFVRRSLAGLTDATVLLLTAGTLNAALLAVSGAEPLLGGATGLAAMLAILDVSLTDTLRHFAPFIAMSALYFGLFWSLTGRTLGGRLLDLRVVDRKGQPPRHVFAVLRVAGHFVGLGAGLLGWLWTALDAEKRGWHDHLAGTYVVRNA
ncbi:MAG: RDD family protein [Myxococcota bacterium]